MKNNLLVMLGCDCDPDRPQYGGIDHSVRRHSQKWRGMEEGIGVLRERLYRLRDSHGVEAKIVFCLRADAQMEEIYGEAAWPIKQYADMLLRLAEEGHELAWHPHLWRWSEQWGCWYQDVKDSEWIVQCLDAGYSGFSDILGSKPLTCHMGWTFHNNVTMKKIADLGVKVDFSACPGVFYEGGPGGTGTALDNVIDWRGTPHRWYYPSAADYRRPARGDEQKLAVVEVPKFTSQSKLLRKAKHLVRRAGQAYVAGTAASVFLQMTAVPVMYDRVIRERLQTHEADPFFVSYFHPDELLPGRPRSTKGFLYSLNNLEKNLIKLIEAARLEGTTVEFATGSDVLRHVTTAGNESGNHEHE